VVFGRGSLWHGLPTFETLGLAARLVREAVATAQGNAAPAPTSPGLIFVVGFSLGLVALAVDYLAVTRRSPSLAGLPLLTVFLVAVANRSTSLSFMYFVVAAAMWLVLVARAGGALLGQWGNTMTVAHTPAPPDLEARSVEEYASVARTLAVVALIAAVAVPVVLPQAPATFLLSGLGRSRSATGGDGKTVGFSQSLDLAADLKSGSKAAVLQYTTTDDSPPPLRVAVGSYYRPEPRPGDEGGVWLPWGRNTPILATNPDVPEPLGLAASVPRRTYVLNVSHNLLADPNLAAPYPLVDADLAGIAWGADVWTQNIRVAQRPDSYKTSYWRLEPSAAMLESVPSLSKRNRYVLGFDLTLTGPYVDTVTTLTDRLVAGKSTPYDKAMAIQQYLRADGGFKYSLTLVPPPKDQYGNTVGFDPLTNFLTTKQGYCVQFATAMVMMSRAAGIPARMALGFLPGTRTKGVWTVRVADAHAWPELYLDGIGWTRFEPTPSSRAAAPPYAVPASAAGNTPSDRTTGSATAPAPPSTARRDTGDSPTGSNANQRGGLSAASLMRWLTHGWGPVLLASLIGLLGLLAVPTAASWRRRRRLRAAGSAAERVEVEWELLTSSLGDFGIAPAPSRTPRQLRDYYDRQGALDGADSQALGRLVQTLERSRYAVSPGPAADVSADARQVVRAVASTQRGRDRLRAVLLPSSGIAQLSSARASFTRRVRAPLRRARERASSLRQRIG
jgi:transglutaminase-like putative cysteine protease